MPPAVRLFFLIGVGGASYAAALVLISRAGLWPDHALILKRLLPFRRAARTAA
jgi:hypothetical protein